MSVNAASHDMVGFNAWDEEWEEGGIRDETGVNDDLSTGRIRSKNYIRVVPNTVYFANIAGANAHIFCYDIDKTYLGHIDIVGNSTFTTMDKTAFIRFRTNNTYGNTYKNDICINLSWDGERDGDYEQYVKRSYPLDESLELRGIPKLDANNHLYYDGDTYEADGTVTRKYGIVDMGTLDWSFISSPQWNCFSATVTGKKFVGEFLCQRYTQGIVYGTENEKVIQANSSNAIIYIRDSSYSDVASFKSAMSGVMLVYELATPTTEEADPFQNPQVVDDFGTEEYVDAAVSAGTRDVAIPVGHVTNYMANLKAKLEMLPNSPDGDGDYIVRQANGQNTFVLYSEVHELPDAPAEDGTYVLKCTVSNGTATYAWVLES